MSDAGQIIQEDVYEPSNFAMIPKMAMMDLDPYELALYCHYKITARDTGGCWKSNKTLANETGMSARKLQDCRLKLVEKGYITVTYSSDETGNINTPPVITIVNVWSENRLRYGKKDTPPMQEVHTPHAQGAYPHAQGAPKVYVVKENEKDTAPNGAGTSSNGKKPSTPKRRVQNPKNKAEWMGRLEPVDTLVHALLGKFDEGYAKGLHATPAEYVTVAHLKKYVPVAEELHDLGAQPDEVARVYAWAKAQYDAKGWTMGLSTVLEKYQTWKATTAAKPATPKEIDAYKAWREAEVAAQAELQGEA